MNSVLSVSSNCGNSNRKQMVQAFPMFTRSHTFLGLYLFPTLLLMLSIAPSNVDASCYRYSRFMNCLNQLPTKEDLEYLGMSSSVTLQDFDGDLRINFPTKEDMYSVANLQIQKSNIRSIAPYFFHDFSSGGLETLVMNDVNGSFQLDGQTLGKLENLIKSIRVSRHRVQNIDYFVHLKRLNTLSLGRTQMTKLPENFGTLLGQLTNVDLSINELTTLPWDVLARRIRDVDFQKIRVPDNPFHCDCTMQPMLEVPEEFLDKIVGFHCATPKEVSGYTLREFRNAGLCKKPPIKEPIDDGSSSGNVLIPMGGESDGAGASKPDGPTGIHTGFDESNSNVDMESEGTAAPTSEVASAGLSTEVIVVIVAVVIVVLIVLIAAIVFKARQSSQRGQQQTARKQPSQRSSSYCAVVEHPPTSRNASGSSAPKSGGISSASNNYGRDVDHIERQPLAPGYRDNRL